MYRHSAHVVFTLFVLALLASTANAANVTVNCDAKKNNSIQAALDSLSKQGPHTVTVSGACVENVDIEGFDNLSLIASPGASITHSLGPPINGVISIVTSRVVVVDGFTITGGNTGIVCFVFSSCRLSNNTVQETSDWAIAIGRSSSAELNNTTILNSAGGLLVSWGGASAVWYGGLIQGITGDIDSGYSAVEVSHGSYLRIYHLPSPTFIQQNAGDGVVVTGNSTLELFQGAVNINHNGGSGIVLDRGSVMEMRANNVITSNTGNGLRVGQSSFAQVPSATTMNANKEPQVVCAGTFSNVKGGFSDCSNP